MSEKKPPLRASTMRRLDKMKKSIIADFNDSTITKPELAAKYNCGNVNMAKYINFTLGEGKWEGRVYKYPRSNLASKKLEVLEKFYDSSLTKSDLCHLFDVMPRVLERFVDSHLGAGSYRDRKGAKSSKLAPKQPCSRKKGRYMDAAANPEVAARRQVIMQHWPAPSQNQY